MTEMLRSTGEYIQYNCRKIFSKEYQDFIRCKTEKIFSDITDQSFPVDHENKNCIITTGFSASGKTTFSDELKRMIPSLAILDSENIQKELRIWLKNNEFWTGQFLTNDIRMNIIRQLCENNYQIVNSSVNLKKCERKKKIRILKEYGYKILLVWVNVDEKELRKRLLERDANNSKNGKTSWIRLYEITQKPNFEIPSNDESDEVMVFNSGIDSVREKVLPWILG